MSVYELFRDRFEELTQLMESIFVPLQETRCFRAQPQGQW